MQKRNISLLLGGLLIAGAAASTQVTLGADKHGMETHELRRSHHRFSFQRIATVANYLNNEPAAIGEETVSEIVAATKDGKTLVYTDSPRNQIGFVDITDPADPKPAGVFAGLGGEPTSVDVLGNDYALVAVNTSADFVNTSGKLIVVDIHARAIVGSIDLDGQPDSIKISPDGRYVAIAIENERDEDIEIDGVEGGLPQSPAGYLAIVDITGSNPRNWVRRDVDLTGLASYGGDDPEPEFVDINPKNEAVVTLQENNHVAIVDLVTGTVTDHFDLGTVTLQGIDATEDDNISLSETLFDVPREPDAATWLPNRRRGGKYLIATANEGDLFGGSRGFSLFTPRGKLTFDSGVGLEELAVRHGHYPERRSENKGTEPEAIEYGRFRHKDFLFVASERGSFIAVYRVLKGRPVFKQLLPGPLGPEGLLAIPSRDLLIVSGEEDDPSFGVRSSIMIYQLKRGRPNYPQIVSDDMDGSPIPWSALSGMVAVPDHPATLLAVWDSFYSDSKVFRINASVTPALITDSFTLQGGSGDYDPEGIAIAPDHTLWIASEGNADDSRLNRLVQTDLHGNVMTEVNLPQGILDCRAASTARGTLGAGFEGVAVLRNRNGYRLLVAQQRGWDYTTADCEDLDDDADGLNSNGEPNQTRIWIYDPQTDSWDHIAWELAPLPTDASWVGLSEITRAPDGSYIVLERDNRTGNFAELKTLVKVRPRAARDGLISNDEKSVYDLIPDLQATNGLISDKPEGVAITPSGHTFVVTDNDGVDEWSGETWFLDLGFFRKLFR